MKNQEEKKEKQSEDLVSLNDSLYNEFSLEELEKRLETDPLLFGNLVDPLCFIDFSCTCKKVHIPVSMEVTLALVMEQILIVQSFSK